MEAVPAPVPNPYPPRRNRPLVLKHKGTSTENIIGKRLGRPPGATSGPGSAKPGPNERAESKRKPSPTRNVSTRCGLHLLVLVLLAMTAAQTSLLELRALARTAGTGGDHGPGGDDGGGGDGGVGGDCGADGDNSGGASTGAASEPSPPTDFWRISPASRSG